MSERRGFLEAINTEFENTFLKAAALAKDMGCQSESLLAAKRIFSYNPNSSTILTLFPQFKEPITTIGKLVEKHGQELKIDSTKYQLWTTLGYCYIMLGDFPNAFAAFAHTLRFTPDSNDEYFWYAMGIVYGHYAYNEQAIACFKKVIALNQDFPKLSDVTFRFGILYRILNNFEDSIQKFSDCMLMSSDRLSPYDIKMQIAYTYQLAGDVDKSRCILEEIYQANPKALKILQHYAFFIFQNTKNGDFTQLKSFLENSLSIYPTDPTLHIIAARMYVKMNDTKQAYTYYKNCISYCSESAYFWCGLGNLYFENDQLGDAIVAFQRAIYLKPDFAEAYLNLGLTQERCRDSMSAITAYQAGSQKCPGISEFSERLSALTIVGQARSVRLMELDDRKFVDILPEQFARQYLASVPELPSNCFGIGKDADSFVMLNTLPNSFFSQSYQ